MKAHLSLPSLYPHFLLPKPISRKSHTPFTIFNSTSDHQKPLKKKSQNIGNLQPPWLISPPSHPSSSHGNAPLLDHQLKESSIPISLRLLQLKKKNENSALKTIPNSSGLGSVGNAVWTLACLLENLQKSAFPVDEKEIASRVRRDNRYSLVWLFQRVYSDSPELAIGLILMTADFLLKSVDGFVCGLGTMILEKQMNCNVGNFCEDYQKVKLAYEHMIVREARDSMILSNYAQLLYEYEKDFDRAGDYFQWAVKTEPVDPEAMCRYALFLWHVKGDTEGAEEMFLEAIQEDPQNAYYRSNYVWFLNQTGDSDICYPLNESSVDNKDEEVRGC